MPLPQLNTSGIDVSNALFKIAAMEQDRQEQAKVNAFREQQLKNTNALTQYQQNRLKAAQLKDELDMAIKQIGMIDYSKGVQDHNDFKAWVESQNPAMGKMIPLLDPADTTSLERGKAWQKRSMELLGSHKAGYVPKEVRLIDESTGEESIEWAIPGEKFVPPKGKRLYNAKEENKEEKLYPTEEGFLPAETAKGKKPFRADRQPAPLPETDWTEIGTKIGLYADKPEVVAEMADRYNNESPYNAVFVQMTHKVKQKVPAADRTFPWSDKEEEVDQVRMTRIDLDKYGLSKAALIKYANEKGVPLNQVVDAAIKIKTRKGTKK